MENCKFCDTQPFLAKIQHVLPSFDVCNALLDLLLYDHTIVMLRVKIAVHRLYICLTLSAPFGTVRIDISVLCPENQHATNLHF